MFLGHLQVLFYAIPPNYELLISEPGNGPLFKLVTSLSHLGGASYQKFE